IIKGVGSPANGDASSALIISQGGRIIANGTQELPIIFTAESDDVDDPEDLDKSRKGLWGGLILLGNAPVGVDGDLSNVEGIPSTEGRAQYGGNDPEDNSGSLRYISIRHGGDKLEANNEINGLTLAGVGSGTTIDYVEVFANLDDGIEWFGGTVSVKHAAVAFCGDDSFDYDQSWDGNGQFWFSIQDELSNRAGEWDGSEKGDLTPKVTPVISNATLIGAGPSSVNEDNNDALRIRDDAAVNLHNSILTGFARRAIVLDNDSEQDTYQRFLDGDVVFNRNIFFDFGAGDAFADIITTDGGDDNLLITQLTDNLNTIEDPSLGGISRIANGGLDPRPNAGSPAFDNPFTIDDPFFTATDYRGAFNNSDNWLEGWTALDDQGFFSDLVVISNTEEYSRNDNGLAVKTFPNPATFGTSTIEVELPGASTVMIQLYDLSGRLMTTLNAGNQAAGTAQFALQTSQLTNGIYLLNIVTDFGSIRQKVQVMNR
ncbi:MAG: T9SS type A sorting domain-containing protein, partial [Bacteroidota bacterium]